MPLSESRKRANKKWKEQHREANRIINSRSQAKSFIRRYASMDDLNDLIDLIHERKDELNK